LAQLDKEQALFFSTPFTLGQHRLRQEVQQTPLCLSTATQSGQAPCVENRRWTVGDVTCATADPGWDQADATRAPLRDPKTLAETDGQPDGFQSFLSALRDRVVAFRKPVVYVHGDSHYFRIDKPLQNSAGQRLENFTRLETFGDHQENGNNDVNWVKVTVDPDSREVFSYQPQIVPGNRTAVPAP
jgi:hypothetical protein